MRILRKLLIVRDLASVLGDRIRELRRNKGFSQESFADHCGLHRTYMGGIERGEHNLTVQTALTIASGLGITLSKLFTGLEDLVKTQSGDPVIAGIQTRPRIARKKSEVMNTPPLAKPPVCRTP